MIQTTEHRIGDLRFQITQLSGVEGRRMLVRLFKITGSSLGAMVSGGMEEVGEALVRLASRINEEDLENLCRIFGKNTLVRTSDSGEWSKFDENMQGLLFAGRYMDLFKWVGFCLEFNFADFLGEMGGIQGAFNTLIQTPSQSPSPSQ